MDEVFDKGNVCIQRSMRECVRGIRMPVVTTFSPASVSRSSKAAVNFESRSRIKNLALLLASSSCTIHSAVGCALAPRIRTRRVACSITAKTYRRAPVRVRTSNRSQASSASARLRRKSARVVLCRSGAGGMPCSLRISRTVEAATLMPSAASSPWIRR